ncbi:GNAT family N-acetyltransferase [Pseudomonas fluorescens]|nr:GNAT family N-acetyltransferase [Pseudomonas fluorescens]
MFIEKAYDVSAAVPQCADYHIEVVRSLADAGPYIEAWEALAKAAVEPNMFYSPWALLSALEHLAGSKRFVLLFILRPSEQTMRPGFVIDGFFPLFEPSACVLSPLPVARMVRHRYCFSVAPLVRGGHESEVMRTFLRWLHTHRKRYPLLRMPDAPADGPLADALRGALREEGRRFHEGAHWQRALMRLGDDTESYMERALSSKERREYRRRRNRLAELGDLRFRALQPSGEDLAAWLAAFVKLEMKGWKGESHSALGSRPECLRYFEAVASAAYARGQLVMLEMSLDGRPLAMLCDFLAPPAVFAFKIAFDEDYAKHSPGVLLILEYIQRRNELQERGVEWMDSCSSPDSLFTNRLWLERKSLCTFLLSNGSPQADLWVNLYPYAKRLKEWLKRRYQAGRQAIGRCYPGTRHAHAEPAGTPRRGPSHS